MKKQIQEFIAQNRQNIIDDWRDLVNMEGSCRQPDAMHTIADWLCEKFQQAGVDCQVYRVRDEVPPVVAGVIGADRPGTPVILPVTSIPCLIPIPLAPIPSALRMARPMVLAFWI